MKNTPTMKRILSATVALFAAAAFAVPSIDTSSVSLTQNPSTRLVTVQYTLTGDPAVVTVDFQTNNVSSGTWASIGGDKYSRLVGDVNKLVTRIGSTSTIYWQPTKEYGWPNQHIEGGNFRAVVKAWATNAPPPYMIVDLQDNPGEARYYPSAEAIPCGITNDLYKTSRLAFRLVPASLVTYRMGARAEVGQTFDGYDYGGKETVHNVTFTNDWYMGVYPVTQRQHRFFATTNPSTSTNHFPETETYPVETVIWTKLRGEFYTTGKKGDWPTGGHELDKDSILYAARNVTLLPSLDLPTEAMWEYACRAETSTATYAGNLTAATSEAADPVLERIAWYKANSDGHTHPVGLKEANGWGFFDMLGNVGEFTLDRSVDQMSSDDVIDPPGPTSGGSYAYRIYRGGGWETITYRMRAAFRAGNYGHAAAKNDIGYRLCCSAMALR